MNLIHNQTLRRPSRGKERSDSARPDYKPSKNFVSRVVNCSAAYRHIRSYTRTGEYSKYHCGIVGEILAGYHSVAGIISGVNYMLDSIGMASVSVYYRVSWNWSYVRPRNRLRPLDGLGETWIFFLVVWVLGFIITPYSNWRRSESSLILRNVLHTQWRHSDENCRIYDTTHRGLMVGDYCWLIAA